MTETRWFKEQLDIHKGRALTVEYTERLLSYNAGYQKIEVFDTVSFGKMLSLDGVIMVTEYDNFAYHEMLAHVPMNAHPNPERILVVGRGDGGTLTELMKHDTVKTAVLCEIDKEVIEVSKKFFPDLARGFDDKRVSIVIEDAAEFIKTQKNTFDIICVDSSDPIGPAEILFKKEFYQDLKAALCKDGIAATQSESMYYDSDFIASLFKQNKDIFNFVRYYFTLIPTYPSGQIGFSFCSGKYDFTEHLSEERINRLKPLKYYNSQIHRASFVLPEFIRKKLIYRLSDN